MTRPVGNKLFLQEFQANQKQLDQFDWVIKSLCLICYGFYIIAYVQRLQGGFWVGKNFFPRSFLANESIRSQLNCALEMMIGAVEVQPGLKENLSYLRVVEQ